MQDRKYPLVSMALGAAVLGAVAVTVLLVRSQRTNPEAPLASAESPSPAPPSAHPEMLPSRQVAPSALTPSTQSASERGSKTTPPKAVLPSTELPPVPSPETRELVNRLLTLSSGDGRPAVEGTAWKQNLQQLVQQGTNGIPAIREFLAKNTDVSFDTAAQQALGYTSVRTALFDALGQIGGPEAVGALTATLQTTADPREIATLAQSLDKLDPGQHQQDAVAIARQTLGMAADGKLPGMDVAPLFEVLQKYGDASVVPDLQQAASHWNIYATVALAQMPDGAGVPALVHLAQVQDGSDPAPTAAALQMLGGVAAQFPEARTALVDLARADKLSAYNWGTLGPILAGEQYHFQNSVLDPSFGGTVPDEQGMLHCSGNQNLFFVRAAGNQTPEQISQQTALIDQLLAVTSNPTAVQTLQRSKAILLGATDAQ